jgi:putative chitobiose transport system substrate-binding protein
MKTWKRLGVFALLGLLLSWLISCGSGVNSGQKATGKPEIEFWTMQLAPQFNDYFNDLIARFEKENPGITVRWVDVPWTAMESKILTAVSANRIPADVKEQYLPNIWKASILDGKSFGIPWYLTTRVTIYNTDLLKKAGVNQPPTTYTELAQVAKQIKDKTGKYAFFATLVPEDSAEVLESFVQMGVPLLNDQGKAAFNTPQGKAAFQTWIDLYKNGLLPQEALTEGHRHAIDLYQRGDTAMLASGAEFLNTIAKNAPSIAKVSASAPQITGETGKKNVAVMNLVIPKDTDQPDAALKFALFVTNNENQLAFAKAANVLPSTQEALKDSYFQTPPANATPVDQARIISAKQLQDAEVLIPATKGVKKLQKIVYDNLQAAMLGQKNVDQAIDDAAQEWDQQA